MATKKVIVTGIGGNVGQGIIRNIRKTGFNITVVGTNIDDFSAGNHLCDTFYKVPYAMAENYISEIIKIVTQEKIELIIPSTDYEVYYLSKFKNDIPCKIAVSEESTASTYLDKFLTFKHLNMFNIPFATSYLPSNYNNEFNDIILKPRKGRGSRGLRINPISFNEYEDDEYMIQELHKGIEITTAFYVNKKNELHGFITLDRVLENGTTTHCKVVKTYDLKLKKLLEKIIKVSKIKGSANIQSIVNSKGEINPFEINCRISGTNSIRSNFGFEDVKYTLEEWLYNIKPTIPKIKTGVATRILMDVIYEGATDFSKIEDNSSKPYIY